MLRISRRFTSRSRLFHRFVGWTMIWTLMCYTALPQIGLCFCANCGCAVNFAKDTESPEPSGAEMSPCADLECGATPKSSCCRGESFRSASLNESDPSASAPATQGDEQPESGMCVCKGRCDSCPDGGNSCSCSVETSELAITVSASASDGTFDEFPAVSPASLPAPDLSFHGHPDADIQCSPNIVLPRLHLLLLVWRN